MKRIERDTRAADNEDRLRKLLLQGLAGDAAAYYSPTPAARGMGAGATRKLARGRLMAAPRVDQTGFMLPPAILPHTPAGNSTNDFVSFA